MKQIICGRCKVVIREVADNDLVYTDDTQIYVCKKCKKTPKHSPRLTTEQAQQGEGVQQSSHR